MRPPRITAVGLGLLGCAWGPTMRWMDCLANFGLLQPDYNCVKPLLGKMVNFGGVFSILIGVWWEPLGSWLGDLTSWDVDEVQQCGGWITWITLSRYHLTLTARNLAWERQLIWGVFSVLLGVWWGPLRSRLGELAVLNVDEVWQSGWWIVWRILGHYNLTFTVWNLNRLRQLI